MSEARISRRGQSCVLQNGRHTQELEGRGRLSRWHVEAMAPSIGHHSVPKRTLPTICTIASPLTGDDETQIISSPGDSGELCPTHRLIRTLETSTDSSTSTETLSHTMELSIRAGSIGHRKPFVATSAGRKP
jgi:hypothetical protein